MQRILAPIKLMIEIVLAAMLLLVGLALIRGETAAFAGLVVTAACYHITNIVYRWTQ